MNTKRSAMLSGAAVLGIAVAILGVSILAGTLVLSTLVRTAGSSASFSYSGQVNLGFSVEGPLSNSVVAGQQYLVMVINTDALASQVVVAA